MAKSGNVDLIVQVTCICAPDSERRISCAINLLLATAQPNKDCAGNTDENEIQESGSSDSDDEGGFAGEGS